MKITDRLNVEHGVFLGLLQYLQDLLEAGAPLTATAASARTIAEAHQKHSRLEDEELIPLIRGILEDDPTFQAVEAEHRRIEQMVTRVTDRGVDEQSLRTFVEVLRAHIGNEMQLLERIPKQAVPPHTLRIATA